MSGLSFATTYTNLPDCFFTYGEPEAVSSPEMIQLNSPLSALMGVGFADLSPESQASFFSGNQLPEGVLPYSQAYCGHQFGYFNQLGDGRVHVWGEHCAPDGKRYEIQLKGSGRTCYSRGGDGRAALGPMLREYLMAESMHALGIPTTRSLAVVTTGETVWREGPLLGAVLTRVASSYLRFGTFEFAAMQNNPQLLVELLDYALWRHGPGVQTTANKAQAFLQAVMYRHIDLVVHWMRVGFIHGVMNTDNMLISGETIDYGPCAFLDAYDERMVLSAIDTGGRYAYANQPKIVQWNLARLAETLLPLLHSDTSHALAMANEVIGQFPALYKEKWMAMMRHKLGFSQALASDEGLIIELLQWMQKNHADYTNTFRDLSAITMPDGALYTDAGFTEWYQRWQLRLKQNDKPLSWSVAQMQKSNPFLIPRNHRVDQALQAAISDDMTPFDALLQALQMPYETQEKHAHYRRPPTPDERILQTFCGT